MLDQLKNLWNRLTGHSSLGDRPGKGPSPELEPVGPAACLDGTVVDGTVACLRVSQVPEFEAAGPAAYIDGTVSSLSVSQLPELEPAECAVRYVLPRLWSLHFALTKKQWADLRQRHKKLYPEQDRCPWCPKRCPANTLDEQWSYDGGTHTKIFIGVAFICAGCHWLKSLTWRAEAWLKLELKRRNGSLRARAKPAHIIDCLGWTQQEVHALRDYDLGSVSGPPGKLLQFCAQFQPTLATASPPPELERLVKLGQATAASWRVDLSALGRYGYSQSDIAAFEQRMHTLAVKRMAGASSHDLEIAFERDQAFNRGCDARLAGLPESANPYTDTSLAGLWLSGWKDVDEFWGTGAKCSRTDGSARSHEMDIDYERRQAFNRGCDARLVGMPESANPYTNTSLAGLWQSGWQDVDKFWGTGAKCSRTDGRGS